MQNSYKVQIEALLSKDKDDQHEFMQSIKQNMYDHFSYYFNEMLQEELAWRKSA